MSKTNIKMQKKLQLIAGELGIIFTEEERRKYQMVEGDVVDFSDMFLIDAGKIKKRER